MNPGTVALPRLLLLWRF